MLKSTFGTQQYKNYYRRKVVKSMRFSVVIPLYNKARYIEKTIQCVLCQSNQDFEIIVIDDGSTDQSLLAARKINDDRITVIAQENGGVSVARNAGIEHAAGEFIAFLDADDIWEANYLETIGKLIDEYPQSDIFVTSYMVDFGNGKNRYSTQLTKETGCLDSYWRTLAKGYDFVWTSATVVRRQALLEAGCFRPGETIGQDLDMWARLARNNPRVAFSSKVCARYNRCAEENARTRIKIACASAFLKDLEEELECYAHTPEEYAAIQKKYDKKMTVYIFTAILAGEKRRALSALKSWRGNTTLRSMLLKCGLIGAYFTPRSVNEWVYKLRLKLF